MAQPELFDEELKIMNRLLHAESLSTIIEETQIPAKVVADIIRMLVHHRFVKPVDKAGSVLGYFDSDKFKNVRFILTAKGIDALNQKKD